MANPALISRRLFKLEHGEKVELSDDDLRDANLSAVIVEEVWDTKHPACPFVKLDSSDQS